MAVDREAQRERGRDGPIERLIAAARAYPDEPRDARRRLIARVRAEAGRAEPHVAPSRRRAGGLVTAWRWWLRPRTLRVRLATLSVGAVAAAGALWLGGARTARAWRTPPEGGVQFVHLAPGARSVSLVGDFNDWEPGATPLRRAGPNGVWTAEVPLEPGRHVYAFLVDDAWTADPFAPRAPDDGFGTPGSVVVVDAGGHS